ncbi:enoyl-CoA hydratase/isomerase family protein [Billgrantia endophytica]|uniref:Enoyl-CoA hydratase/isomerase family protein n=1 Tax=Billgrantia endophytica TaxID=2033802 RepID=A0A2N7U4W9_9GAMM|nr:enoyl-CoA hydratase/isomerase family protein [Halomonas endophytica]PMR75472.1 enoyl-CoA hydratase/isomerase family protein [Halomonas endophytica]
MAADHLVVESDGPLLRVTINRLEKRNALSRAVLNEIATTFTEHAGNPQIKAVVLTGAGDKSFAAGGDLHDLANVRTEAEALAMSREARRSLTSVAQFPVPVIAALNGDALGGGAELAVACDFIVAASTSRIGFIQGKLNISTAWGGGIRLRQRIGMTQALRLLSRAELLGASDAERIGLVDCTAAPDQSLDACVHEFCHPILQQAPQVLRAFKALTTAHDKDTSVDVLKDIETRHFVSTWIHDDHWAVADEVLNARRSQ